jgi:integrase
VRFALYRGEAREIGKLLWSDFNLEDKVLRIREEISKTNRHRIIHLSENLIAYLSAPRREASHGRMDSGDSRSGTQPTLAVNAREAVGLAQARAPQCAPALLRLTLLDEARQH